MEYEVILTTQAKVQFREMIDYLVYKIENPQAAANVVSDFEQTITRLSRVAGSVKLCDDEILRAKGYRTIPFRQHRYLIVYRISGNTVYAEGIYHTLQDYENILR